ncbi:hypothetical protein EJ03DRAFT_333427 [Teratosphaeria nubilosa]|uniref:F-box domain-containing protein n=1 Tax=Teratosphaeria nubilosa TaxID=161662 RepID=A0A6G1LK25_9PEZI|nr:hypothetical protein EJ03DRAFT_333427 [Teratosphaeria nubilosa]
MDRLPRELLEAVLENLPLADLMRARRVCRAFRDTIATAPELRRLQKVAAVFGNGALLEKVTEDLDRREFLQTTRVCQIFRRDTSGRSQGQSCEGVAPEPECQANDAVGVVKEDGCTFTSITHASTRVGKGTSEESQKHKRECPSPSVTHEQRITCQNPVSTSVSAPRETQQNQTTASVRTHSFALDAYDRQIAWWRHFKPERHYM